MGRLANSEDPDEMPHYAAFHLGLIFRKNRRIMTCGPQYIYNGPS